MKNAIGNLLKKVKCLTGKMEEYQEAITFAEAGHSEQAKEVLVKENIEDAPKNLLVIGQESRFSKDIIDYAIDMAKRMSYHIIALNTAPLSCETFKLFSSSRNRLCKEFQKLSEENVKEFKEKAEKLHIPFTHVVKFREVDEAVEELKKEYKDIEFIVSEAIEEGYESITEDVERPRQEICVYSML